MRGQENGSTEVWNGMIIAKLYNAYGSNFLSLSSFTVLCLHSTQIVYTPMIVPEQDFHTIFALRTIDAAGCMK